MQKKILYLDQNFVSNLAKVENTPDWKDPQKTYYKELLHVIRAKVNQNRIACPTSPFHQEESEQGDRVKNIVWYVMEQLSRGLSFRYSTEIFHDQIVLAAYKYCGITPPQMPEWTLAFNKDPSEPVENAPFEGQILVHLGFPEELVENGRSLTNLVADVYSEFKATRHRKSRSFNEEVYFQKYQVLRETFLPPGLILQAFPQLDNKFGQFASLVTSQMKLRLSRILMNLLKSCSNPSGFWGSQELLSCPYLKIRASLMAADIFLYPQKTPTPSLNTDFDIMASVIPYADMVATENHMSELIRQSKLSQQFRAQVYPMKQRTQLLDVLENL